MHIASIHRQPYYHPQIVYPQPIMGFRQQYYKQVPQIYQQPIYPSYNGFQIPRVSKTLQPSKISQILQSPQKNFQSPTRGFGSPSRNNLMQSQSQSHLPQQLLQSPSRQGFYTYEQVMERIKNAQQQQLQNQQSQQQLPQSQQQPDKHQTNLYQQKQAENNQIPLQEQAENKQNNNQEQQKIQSSKQQEASKQPEDIERDGELQELALQYEDGYIYRGQGYSPQTREGFGMLTDNEGREVYVGYWKQNFYEGQGRLQNLQVEQIDDAFDCNNMTTIGNGWQSYEGQFVGGKMHGQGMLLLSNGEKYVGEFDDGMIHGDGEFTTLQNEVITGNWDQGYLVSMSEE